MLIFCSRMVLRPYAFATAATRDTLDYYRLLDVHSGATQQAIRESYFELTQNLRPELDTLQFKTLNEAYIILTDNKTRDAYDSLLAVRKSFYLS